MLYLASNLNNIIDFWLYFTQARDVKREMLDPASNLNNVIGLVVCCSRQCVSSLLFGGGEMSPHPAYPLSRGTPSCLLDTVAHADRGPAYAFTTRYRACASFQLAWPLHSHLSWLIRPGQFWEFWAHGWARLCLVRAQARLGRACLFAPASDSIWSHRHGHCRVGLSHSSMV